MPHPIHTKLARNRAKLLDVLSTLADDQLDQRSAEGWSIREMLTHLLNAEEDNTEVITAIVEGNSDQIPAEFDLDAHNVQRVNEREAMTLDELLVALAAQRERTESLLGGLSEGHLQLTGRHPLAGDSTVNDIFRFIVLHDPLHARDIKAILSASEMGDTIESLMRAAIEIAQSARDRGNHPFGALLVDQDDNVLLTAENTVVTENDCTGHAETNVMRLASRKYDPDFLATCTLYTSTEPCPMCSSAIFWGNVRRVVYGLSQQRLYALVDEASEDVLRLPCRELFAKGHKQIEVIGPVLEEEALSVHQDFWT